MRPPEFAAFLTSEAVGFAAISEKYSVSAARERCGVRWGVLLRVGDILWLVVLTSNAILCQGTLGHEHG